jgi:multidrug efflux pump subunit AcrA (membrane-fusion protein)
MSVLPYEEQRLTCFIESIQSDKERPIHDGAGTVASLFVAPGDTVKRGDVLLVLEERPTPS